MFVTEHECRPGPEPDDHQERSPNGRSAAPIGRFGDKRGRRGTVGLRDRHRGRPGASRGGGGGSAERDVRNELLFREPRAAPAANIRGESREYIGDDGLTIVVFDRSDVFRVVDFLLGLLLGLVHLVVLLLVRATRFDRDRLECTKDLPYVQTQETVHL